MECHTAVYLSEDVYGSIISPDSFTKGIVLFYNAIMQMLLNRIVWITVFLTIITEVGEWSGADPGFVVKGGAWVGEGSGDL